MTFTASTRKTPARLRLLDLLKHDLQWYHYSEIYAVAGVRYSARILELKRLGYEIESRACEDGKWYRLRSRVPGTPKPKRVKVFLTEEDAQALLVRQLPESAYQAIREALESYRERRSLL